MTDKTLDVLSACIRLSRKLLETAAVTESLSATDIVACGALAKPWVTKSYNLGDICQHNGMVYRCCQAHDCTNNPAWEPGSVPALWTAYHTTDPARALPYTAPCGAHDVYNINECMMWTDGEIYQCLIDATDRGPNVLPSAWKLL